MEQKYRISLQLGDIKVEIESSDKSWIEDKEAQYIDKFIEKAKKLSQLRVEEPTKIEEPQVVSDALTIHEFYNKYMKGKMRTRTKIAVFFVYYLQKIQKRDDVRTQDVLQCFADIGYPNYNKINMTDTLTGSKKRGLLNYVNKIWSLTTTGEDYVLNAISSEK